MRTKEVKVKLTVKLIKGSPNVPIHAEIYGALQTATSRGYRYFLTLILAHQKYSRINLLKRNNEIKIHCHEFITWIEKHTVMNVRRFHCDNVPEFLAMRSAFNRVWVTLRTSSAYTPHSNGLAERMNRTILNKLRAMIAKADVSNRF